MLPQCSVIAWRKGKHKYIFMTYCFMQKMLLDIFAGNWPFRHGRDVVDGIILREKKLRRGD